MATGGVEYSRDTCSVCLEPFRGRQPKLLPCFHTFCVPCLARLVRRETQTCPTPVPDSEDEEGRSEVSVTLTCPSCRRVTAVPPGGVTAFQTNFYLDTDSREADGPPAPCSLCDGDHKAQFQCNQCHNTFCSHCRRYHDKLCQATQVTALPDPCDTHSSAQLPSPCQIRQQLEMIDEALKKLTEEERRLNKERKAMDHSVNVRYGIVLRHACEVSNALVGSLGEAHEDLTQRLHRQMAEARQARVTLQQQLSPSQPAPGSASQLRAAQFVQGDLQVILNKSLDSASLLTHQMEDNESLMVECLQKFMGRVVRSSCPAPTQQASGSLSVQDDRGTASSVGTMGSKDLNGLYEKVEDLAGQVTSLQAANTQLSQQVTLLSNANSKLSSEQSALHREMTGLKDQNAKLTTGQAALKDKVVIFQQDLGLVTAEKDKVCAHLAQVEDQVGDLHTQVSSHHTHMVQLKADHGAVLSQVTSVQTDLATVQADGASLKKEVGQLRSDCSDLKSHMLKVQGKTADVEGNHSSLLSDLTASSAQVVSLQQDMKAAQASLQNHEKNLAALESRFATASTQIAFHAVLSQTVTSSSKEETLICDSVITNTGSAYDDQTGVFTAPVTGTYCFLANASPFSDEGKVARLAIVLDGEGKGGVSSEGWSCSTGHTVVRMSAGQRVWLRTFGDGENVFFKGATSLTGMLLQAEV